MGKRVASRGLWTEERAQKRDDHHETDALVSFSGVLSACPTVAFPLGCFVRCVVVCSPSVSNQRPLLCRLLACMRRPCLTKPRKPHMLITLTKKDRCAGLWSSACMPDSQSTALPHAFHTHTNTQACSPSTGGRGGMTSGWARRHKDQHKGAPHPSSKPAPLFFLGDDPPGFRRKGAPCEPAALSLSLPCTLVAAVGLGPQKRTHYVFGVTCRLP